MVFLDLRNDTDFDITVSNWSYEILAILSTYHINRNTAIYLGEGDYNDVSYDMYEVVIPFSVYKRESTNDKPGHCV